MSIDLGNNRLNVGNQLVRAAWRYPDKEAVVCRGKRLTFKELNSRANSLAHGIIELGLKKGDFVSVLMMNCTEYVETYFALAKMGAIIAPLNYRLTPNDLVQLINQCKARAIIFGQEFKDLVKDLRPKIGTVKNYISVGGEAVQDAVPYEDLATGYSTDEPNVNVFQDDGQFVNTTSGTTGLPKASIMTHFNNLAVVMQISLEIGLTSDKVFMTVLPLFNRVGWTTTLTAVSCGCKNVITEIDPKAILEAIQREKVNMVNFVPVITNLLMLVPEFEKYDTSSMELIIYAGMPLTSETREATYKYFAPQISEYYGSTETSLITYCNPEIKKRKPTSLGTPAFGVELRLVDEKDQDVPLGEIGEIIIRSPALNANYFNNPEKAKRDMRGGWFHTGDLGRFDEERHLYVVGRVEDMIISGVDKIFAPEVEEVIQKHPKVGQCAVIGLPDKLLGKVVTAVVTPKPGEKIDEKEIIEYCKGKLANFKIPKKVKTIDAIPRTPTGKAIKFQLVKMFSEQER